MGFLILEYLLSKLREAYIVGITFCCKDGMLNVYILVFGMIHCSGFKSFHCGARYLYKICSIFIYRFLFLITDIIDQYFRTVHWKEHFKLKLIFSKATEIEEKKTKSN